MSTGGARAPRVTLSTQPIWRLRLMGELPRYALSALSLFGILASARFAIAPPGSPRVATERPAGTDADVAARAYAVQFARRYLTWSAAAPNASSGALAPYVGAQMETAAGLVVPPRGEERVQWAEVVQAREPLAGTDVFTVAAQTDTGGLRYLAVPVERTADGALALAGYPAFVGAPASAPSIAPPRLRPVSDPALEVVLRRALLNYLEGSLAELAADLSKDARVTAPTSPLQLVSAQHAQWAQGGGAVIVAVQAVDSLGTRYLLAYELDVVRVQGRWEIAAIETNPDA